MVTVILPITATVAEELASGPAAGIAFILARMHRTMDPLLIVQENGQEITVAEFLAKMHSNGAIERPAMC